MKFAVLIPLLFLSLMNAANAEDANVDTDASIGTTVENSDTTDYSAYCTEQAELSGIDNAAEKNRYIKECIQSYAPPADEVTPQ